MKTGSKISTFLLVTIALAALMPIVVSPVSAANPNTRWIPDQMVSSDTTNDDRRPSITTGAYRNLYAAYEHYNSGTSKYEIKVAKSTDGGTTWSVIWTTIGLTSYNLYNPSIAAEPYKHPNLEYLYVVYEREVSSNNYDILRFACSPIIVFFGISPYISPQLFHKIPCITIKNLVLMIPWEKS